MVNSSNASLCEEKKTHIVKTQPYNPSVGFSMFYLHIEHCRCGFRAVKVAMME